MEISYHKNAIGQKLAYVYSPAKKTGEGRPIVMFLGGFRSDMTGSKALFLEQRCREQGRAYIRFDYTGHGASGGAFEDGTIGSWTQDAQNIMNALVTRDVILVGSSMGGWISLNLLLAGNERIRGVVGIAAAPDFTRMIEPRMSPEQREQLYREGKVVSPSGYAEPYIYTKALIEDGEKHLLLNRKHPISVPLILLQGKQDDAVPWQTANKIVQCFEGPMTEAVFIEDGDHRLSREEDLNLIWDAIQRVEAYSAKD